MSRTSFSGCHKLTTFTVDSENESFQVIENVLYSKDGKRLIYYPQGLELSHVIIPNEVEIIEEHAFEQTFFEKNIVYKEACVLV